MTARAHTRGHPITFDGTEWRYDDTGEPVTGSPERPCVACGRTAEPGGPDPCLGMLPGVRAACCGHGVEPGYVWRAPLPSALALLRALGNRALDRLDTRLRPLTPRLEAVELARVAESLGPEVER